MTARTESSLGPLPKADRNAELERVSIQALKSALPSDRFLFRNERSNDAGVDGSLELLIGSRYTNLRSHVQLKSTDSGKTNADGSISLSVRVTNLNYLLNGASPIYVLYVAPRNELRFAWARDERRRLDRDNPGWMDQESITIRFADLLNEEAIEQVHQRIQQEAQFQRKIHYILGDASATQQILVGISPESLHITDSEEAKRVLLASGTAIVTAGYTDEVKNLIRLLSPADAQLPRILLILAQAEYVSGRYQAAYPALADASLRVNELSDDDRRFLMTIRDGCDYETGRIDISELNARLQENTDQGSDGFALSYQLNRLRYGVIGERDLSKRGELLQRLRNFVRGLLGSTDLSEAFRLLARISLLELEVLQLPLDSLREMGEARLRLQVGRTPDFEAISRNQRERIKRLDGPTVQLIDDATRLGHPLLTALATLVRNNLRYNVWTSRYQAARIFRHQEEIPDSQLQEVLEGANAAVVAFQKAGHLEGELRARISIADLFELAGQQEKAQEIARDVLPKAQAMGYGHLIFRAEAHLSGRGFRSQVDAAARPRSETEKAISSAASSDEELLRNAAQMLKVLELPEDRLPVLEREYFRVRAIAQERVSWCKHIEMREDKRHTFNQATYYRTDPDRVCICALHGYRSAIPDPNWPEVISGFKRAFCEGCPDRNPIGTE